MQQGLRGKSGIKRWIEYVKRKGHCKENIKTLYSLVWGQCTDFEQCQNVVNVIEHRGGSIGYDPGIKQCMASEWILQQCQWMIRHHSSKKCKDSNWQWHSFLVLIVPGMAGSLKSLKMTTYRVRINIPGPWQQLTICSPTGSRTLVIPWGYLDKSMMVCPSSDWMREMKVINRGWH